MKASIFTLALGLITSALLHADATHSTGTQSAAAIPLDQLGAEAQKKYSGDGISIKPMTGGACLKVAFQKLEGVATIEGLWLTSTAEEDAGKAERFRLVACGIGRGGAADAHVRLPATGEVHSSAESALFLRPGLIEEYRVSMDGVRQDFIVLQRPTGMEELEVCLAVSGARAEAAAHGVKLTLTGSGREIAYSGLHVTDAKGRTLSARMEVLASDLIRVCVADDGAAYPVRIDPTFSDADWVSLGSVPGADDEVTAMVVDGVGNLYIGGRFTAVGNVIANGIAKWNGSSWSALGEGIEGGSVEALAVNGGDLYAGGSFLFAGGDLAFGIAKWNGSAWSAMGSGTVRTVKTIAVSGVTVYAGGDFTSIGGVSVNHVAKWDGSAWSALGTGMARSADYSTPVRALAVSGATLYAGGDFTSAGGTSAMNIAKWNGSDWSALGTGVTGYAPAIDALVASGSELYVGGSFDTAGGVSAKNIAKWNGSTWSALGSGVSSNVSAFALSGSDLFVGGTFETASGVVADSVAKWDGSSWSALGSTDGVSWVNALAVIGSDLYIGGRFNNLGAHLVDPANPDWGLIAHHIARWNGSAWSALGGGIVGDVRAIALNGSDLYIGGTFFMTDMPGADGVAKWNGSSWSSLSTGVDGWVNALVFSGSQLYAGGTFTYAGGVSVKNIARWNGTVWAPLASGLSGGAPYAQGSVAALAVAGGDIYAAGNFVTAGGVTANSIAKWNGAAWSALGTGVNGSVAALAITGADLYAGGAFTMAGGVAANRIAKWNGSAWSALGSGLEGGDQYNTPHVNALVVSGADLYAGGLFTMAGGISAQHVAKWNGSAWSALGSGIGIVANHVDALAVSGSDLYVGGAFYSAGGVNATHIAKWNGSTWSSMGSGMNNYVFVLTMDAVGHLFVGGRFSVAGTTVSPSIAQANLGTTVAGDTDGDGLRDSWELTYWPSTSGHGPLDDFDHDGICELLELAFGLNPTRSDPGGLPTAVNESGYLTMTITKQAGVAYEVQSAGTLLTAQPTSFSATSTTVNTNNGTTLKVRDNTLIGTASARFMRVRVTAAP